jgi:hypothetical protein
MTEPSSQPEPPQAPDKSGKADKSDKLEAALLDPQVQKIYANGFALGLGNADMYVLLQFFGKPTAVVNLSYTLAKTLQDRLGQVIAGFEARTERKMLKTDEVDAAFGREVKS